MSNLKISIIAGAFWNEIDGSLELDYSTFDIDELTIRIYPDVLNRDEFKSLIITGDDIDDLAAFLNHMRNQQVKP